MFFFKTKNDECFFVQAFSRRANLHEMIRDYGQAASDLKKYIFIVENQSDNKVTPSRSAGSVELKKARRNMALMEEATKRKFPWIFTLSCKFLIFADSSISWSIVFINFL